MKKTFLLSVLFAILISSCSTDEDFPTSKNNNSEDLQTLDNSEVVVINSMEEFNALVSDIQKKSNFNVDSLGVEVSNPDSKTNQVSLRMQLVEKMVRGYSSLLVYYGQENLIIIVSDIQTADRMGLKVNVRYYTNIYQVLNTMTLPSNYSVIMRESAQMGLLLGDNYDFISANKGFRLYQNNVKNIYTMITAAIQFRETTSSTNKIWYPTVPENIEFLFYILVP